MKLTRLEKTIIPQTLEGQKFANEYEQRLKGQFAFMSRKEDTQAITIEARYVFDLRTEEV